ncbi:MAG: hypothetical protein HY721_22130 [Planctomycetes bacterium]|nr:hypothetical protein [Planctomycetota bacterium]
MRLATLLAIACPALLLLDGPAPAAGGDGGHGSVKLSVLLVWASDEASGEKPPAELEKILDQLKKVSKKRSFRLEGKPATVTLSLGKTFTQKLPDGYEAQWTLTVDPANKEKLALTQVLLNPKKEKSEYILRQSPVPIISSLDKIRRGNETLLLVVQFEKGSKDAKKR